LAIDRNKVQQQAEKLVQAKKYDAGIAQYQALVADNPRDLVTPPRITPPGRACSSDISL